MSIEIPDAAKEAAFRDYHGDTDRGYGEISDYDMWAMGAAIEAALPHLIPGITADLRAQYQPVLDASVQVRIEAEDAMFSLLSLASHDPRGIAKRRAEALSNALGGYDRAIDALAGMEGDDGNA